MPTYEYDLFVIGAGSGGVRAARIAAGHGARVAIAEERQLGGTCVNVGCIPKKLLFFASCYGRDTADAAAFGWNMGAPTFDWARLIDNKNREIERLNEVYLRILEGVGVRVLSGRARIADPHRIEVGDRAYTADRILIATGGWPTVPDIPGKEHGITSNEAFFLDRLPERVVIVGGGYVAVEFAGIFSGVGAEVTQLYRGPLFLRGFEEDARSFLAEEMRARAVDLRFDSVVQRIDSSDGVRTVTTEAGNTFEADQVLFATGRRPSTSELGLAELGVELDANGAVAVGPTWQSSVPHIYAIGDVTDRIRLTPVALAEGHALADLLFGKRRRTVDYANVPACVSSDPELAVVGLTEREARERYPAIDVFKSVFRPLRHTVSGRETSMFMKMLVERATDRVVGFHVVGRDAGEMVQGVAVAMRAGATKADFDATIGVHPTAAEEFVTMRTREPDPEPEDEAAE